MKNMLRKGETPITKNVKVTDELGRLIGLTYEKRAKGLVKNGRAIYVDGCTIRMFTNTPPLDGAEVNEMNYIYFNAREWQFDKACNNAGERCFIQNFNGELVEVYQLGNWQYHWSQILSPEWMLSAGTPYTFVFWLNGGENDRNSEVCRLEILFDDDYDNRYVFNLNRSYIKPVLRYRGWELYAISFVTPGMEGGADVATQLRFVAQQAPMTVMHAENLEAYLDWKEELDPYADQRPQRHNIVFEDGWPTEKWYATNKLKEQAEANQKKKKFFAGGTNTTKNNDSGQNAEAEDAADETAGDTNYGKNIWKGLEKDIANAVQSAMQSAQVAMQSAQSFVKNVQSPEYQARVKVKAKEKADKVKVYGNVLGEQINAFVTDMTSAETQEKMQEVLDRIEDAIAQAKVTGDRVSAKVLEKVKTTLTNYREAWKKNRENAEENEALEKLEEQLEQKETELEEAEDAISDLEDEISDMEDEVDELDDRMEELNDEIAEATAGDDIAALTEELREALLEKSDLLVEIDAQQEKLTELRDARDRVEAEVYNLRRMVDDINEDM